MGDQASGRLLTFVLVAVGLSMAAVACGDRTAPPGPSSTTGQLDDGPSAEQIQDAFATLEYDYAPVDSEKELAAMAQEVVTGTIDRVVPGRISGARSMNEPFALRTSAVALTAGQVSKGDMKPGDTVWLELSVTPDHLLGVLERGMPISVYLSPAPSSSDEFPYSDEGSNVPAGATLWTLAHPQGLILEYGNDRGTVVPLADEVHPGDDLPR